MQKRLLILGIRGVPAAHGGFETFAERLCLHLVEQGWQVSVYCQGSETSEMHEDMWRGIRRIHIPVRLAGAAGTVEFDAKATRHALGQGGLILTLGYNTAVLNCWMRFRRRKNLINMDGIEWRRAKWSFPAKIWLWLNERIGVWAGSHLIADHPAIADHLATRTDRDRISVIAYGSDRIEPTTTAPLDRLGLVAGKFLTVVARPEPENSLLEIVAGFSQAHRDHQLVVLGDYSSRTDYQMAVQAAASPEVIFPGAIYDKEVLAALRSHCSAYVHGHQVGGTNPSLVEALGASNAVIAHDNHFNRWVAGSAALYFDDIASCSDAIQRLISEPGLQQSLVSAARARWEADFTWPKILNEYESLLTAWHDKL